MTATRLGGRDVVNDDSLSKTSKEESWNSIKQRTLTFSSGKHHCSISTGADQVNPSKLVNLYLKYLQLTLDKAIDHIYAYHLD